MEFLTLIMREIIRIYHLLCKVILQIYKALDIQQHDMFLLTIYCVKMKNVLPCSIMARSATAVASNNNTLTHPFTMYTVMIIIGQGFSSTFTRDNTWMQMLV